MPASHQHRVEQLAQAYKEANARLMARLAGASADAAQRGPAAGGWSAAQIGWHVARVTDTFADLIAGERPGAAPLPTGFREREWDAVALEIPEKLEASRSATPPPAVTRDDVLAALSGAEAHLLGTLAALTPDRARTLGLTHPLTGTITLYQVGDWATAHVIRHNRQMKRVLAEHLFEPRG
ncbi:MAG TPA: DinB family protein [Vicinamibacterales bacterium]|nr:DinB family protein [Vicinamibacterales bacterium]